MRGSRSVAGAVREAGKYPRGPDLRILVRREAVEKEGIGAGAQFGQQRLGIAEEQGQDYLLIVEKQALRARQQGRPLPAQGRRASASSGQRE